MNEHPLRSASNPWGARPVVLVIVLVAMAALFSAISPQFRSRESFLDQSRYWTEMALVAPFLFLVVLAGGIDLSVGSILGLVGVTVVRLHIEAGWPIALAAATGMGIGALAGLANGVLIQLLGVSDLVATLATLGIYRGLAQAVRQNRPLSNLPEGYRLLSEGAIAGVPLSWCAVVAVWIVAFVVVHRTRLGRWSFAAGSSPEAARFARIPVARARILLYTLSGLGAGLAALFLTARANAARDDDGVGLELDAIACVVLGGASISGGKGSLPGLVLGTLCLGVLRTGLVLSDVSEQNTRLATGIVLLAVALLNERIVRGESRSPA